MNRFFCILTLFAIAASVDEARADGLIVQLPKDGTWAEFDNHRTSLTFDKKTGRALGEGSSSEETLRVSSVGRDTVEGKACRWIEFKLQGSGSTSIVKALIPEEQLKKGGDPAKHIVRGWTKTNDQPPIRIQDDEPSVIQLTLSSAMRDRKDLDPKVVDCKAGKLKCAGLSGTTAWKSSKGEEYKTTHEIRLHEKSPFGVAFWHSENEMEQKDLRWNFKSTLTLVKSGTDAKSELQDQN